MDALGIGSVAALIKDGLDRLFPNKSDPAYIAAQAALIQAQTAGTLKQMDDEFQVAIEQIKTNAVEAASPNLFISGPRPFIMWVCGVAFAEQYVIGPLATWIAGMFGYKIAFPQLDLSMMMPVLLGLLGLGGMRTFEKYTGTQGNH